MDGGAAWRIDRLIRDLGIGEPTGRVFRAAPRHLFIPAVALAHPPAGTVYGIDRNADPTGWWDTVYSDTPIVTQLDDGATAIRDVIGGDGEVDTRAADYTSSNSAPSTVNGMLTRLAPEPGHRVLDVGTGTGWTAALLSHLAGERNVTSVEVDPALSERADGNLNEAGVRPYLVVGDGAEGCPEQAPYDRVHVTCGVRRVPYAWVEQSRPGAVIALPYCPGFGTGHALRLVVGPEGTAHGRFPGFASYMPMRSQRAPRTRPAPRPTDEHVSTTRVDPRTIASAPAGADLAVSTLTGLHAHGSAEPDEDGEPYRMWISDPADPRSWAVVDRRPGEAEYEVYRVGHRPLWEEVVDAHTRWVGWGRRGRERYGITVAPDGQRIWLDSPEHVIG
ncbi:protein-L-isoaspartate O-methyltransferase [Streptosporangium violaceochromogenes]|nr:protein-L-isoaspartate O-methyltransferase [Streptosporangium violaceochromogenes]